MEKYLVRSSDKKLNLELKNYIKSQKKNIDINFIKSSMSLLIRARSYRPDIIVVIYPFEKSGTLNEIRKLRNKEQFENIPIIAVLNNQNLSADKKYDFIRAGGNTYISKPFDILDFYSLAESLIKVGTSDKNLKSEKDKLAEIYKRQSENLQHNQERWRLLLKTTNDGIWDWNIMDGTIETTKLWREKLGYKKNEIKSVKDFYSLVEPNDKKLLREKLRDFFNNYRKSFEIELRIKVKNDGYHWFLYRGTAIWKNNRAIRVFGTQSNIDKKQEQIEDLNNKANLDSLTKIPNRNLYFDRIKIAIARAKRFNHKLAVLFLDLDDFKKINDNYGHNTGDFVLKEVSKRLQSTLRDFDTVSRLGGDEFSIVLNDIYDIKNVSKVSKRILSILNKVYKTDGHNIYTSSSIGISIFPEDAQAAEGLLKKADYAMYAAKKKGKNNFVYYSKLIENEKTNQLEVEQELSRAIMRKEFKLFYQPIIQIMTGKVIGVEALLRWEHPQKGILIPNDFIDYFLESGLMISYNQWLIEEISQVMGRWEDIDLPSIRISVNFSDKEFYHQSFLKNLEKMSNSEKINPQLFVIEIKENVLFKRIEESLPKLKKLEEMGFNIAIDNFGTGYLSFKYLAELPINFIKVDLSFVKRFVNNPNVRRVMSAMVDMAHNLNYKIIAEGVEQIDQLNLINILNYDELQGYLFSKPLPEKELLDIVNKNIYQILNADRLV